MNLMIADMMSISQIDPYLRFPPDGIVVVVVVVVVGVVAVGVVVVVVHRKYSPFSLLHLNSR